MSRNRSSLIGPHLASYLRHMEGRRDTGIVTVMPAGMARFPDPLLGWLTATIVAHRYKPDDRPAVKAVKYRIIVETDDGYWFMLTNLPYGYYLNYRQAVRDIFLLRRECNQPPLDYANPEAG